MTFGEKVKEARLALNMSQKDLAEAAGITERSLYTYERHGTLPRSGNIRKLASALQVSTAYLLDEAETDPEKSMGEEAFVRSVKQEFGSKGAHEARELLGRASALFAGGDLDEDSKDAFFESLMKVYIDSKKTAREKFTPKKLRKHPSLKS